jgi:hypothetical protein
MQYQPVVSVNQVLLWHPFEQLLLNFERRFSWCEACAVTKPE